MKKVQLLGKVLSVSGRMRGVKTNIIASNYYLALYTRESHLLFFPFKMLCWKRMQKELPSFLSCSPCELFSTWSMVLLLVCQKEDEVRCSCYF